MVGVLVFSGCASFKKAIDQKFVRKRKSTKAEAPRARFPVETEQRSTHELYRMHYLLWRGWSGELERDIGTNVKRERQDVRETLRHLESMRDSLKREAAEPLSVHIHSLEAFRERLESPARSGGDTSLLGREIERLNAKIARQFSYERVKPVLKPDAPPFDLNDYASARDATA